MKMARSRRRSPLAIKEPSNELPYGEEDDLPPPISQMQFSQVEPDRSQLIDVAKESEVRKLEGLNPATKHRVVTDLSRLLLFKALNGDPIDRRRVVAEALGDMKTERVQTAALNEAEARLRDVFGFSVRRVPEKMEEALPSRFKDRLYLINDVKDDQEGTHSVNLHSAHPDSCVEKGVLMIVLAFAFCNGSPSRSGTFKGAGKTTRWITEHQLYTLLHRVDENIPSEPPSQEGQRKCFGRGRPSLDDEGPSGGGVAQTPDIDALLERFVALDYLLRDKIEEPEAVRESKASDDGKVVAYAMGPRAAMEIGRRQIIYFCANILDEQPDPTILAEIDEDEDVSQEEDGEIEEFKQAEEPEKKSKPSKRPKER